MKYFQVGDRYYHCNNIFNWRAVDENGTVWLYQNKPFIRVIYWTSGHTDSYDYQVASAKDHYRGDWRRSLVKL